MDFPGGKMVKNSSPNARDAGSIAASGRSLEKEWQHTPVFLPGNVMDRGDWQATVHGLQESNVT